MNFFKKIRRKRRYNKYSGGRFFIYLMNYFFCYLPIKIFSIFLPPQILFHTWLAKWVFYLTFLWLYLGFSILISASYYDALFHFRFGFYYIRRQLVWSLLGFIAFNLILRTPIGLLLKYSELGFFFALISLFFIFKKGIEINGSRRWFSIKGFLIQPSELIKPLWVIQLAKIFSKWENFDWIDRVFWLMVFSFVILFILLQPNLSTAGLYSIILWMLALSAGLTKRFLFAMFFFGFFVVWCSIQKNPYQKLRIISFLNPWNDPKGNGYQLVQSLIAIGCGRIFGRGYGFSKQKLGYLPIHETDFIFSVFAEEFGFLGILSLFYFYGIYIFLCFKVAFYYSFPVTQLITLGSMLSLIIQSFFNIGVAVGALPTTGLPLPFFSYGGDALIACLLNAALIIRVAIESEIRSFYLKFFTSGRLETTKFDHKSKLVQKMQNILAATLAKRSL
uniref:peptidoglycan glycosyltransferase n=1 Tax=Cyanoptyche gloeocystis TaxID=77922 RepID=A0A3G1IW64_9EUKA|nr:plastid division protein [Cyanoptyche gloeocystis]